MELQYYLEFAVCILSGFYFGLTNYVVAVEHPGRNKLGTKLAIKAWQSSFKGTLPFAIIPSLLHNILCIYLWYIGAGSLWLYSTILFFSLNPYTLFILMPVNYPLLAYKDVEDKEVKEAQRLHDKWIVLHAVRGLLAFVFFMMNIYSLRHSNSKL
jgi:hypothetical protein